MPITQLVIEGQCATRANTGVHITSQQKSIPNISQPAPGKRVFAPPSGLKVYVFVQPFREVQFCK